MTSDANTIDGWWVHGYVLKVSIAFKPTSPSKYRHFSLSVLVPALLLLILLNLPLRSFARIELRQVACLGPKEQTPAERAGHVAIVDGFGRMWIHGGTHGKKVPPADQLDFIELDWVGKEEESEMIFRTAAVLNQ